MLLTLATRSLAGGGSGRWSSNGAGMLDMPGFAIRELELRGLNVSASMLSGWTPEQLDELSDQADKAGCPCLVLVDDQPLSFASPNARTRANARDRVSRLGIAGHRLGCSAIAIQVNAKDTEDAFDLAASEIKEAMPSIERLELNLLLAPSKGLTSDPDRLTELIKRIGGFRIGSMPSFEHAASTGDPVEALRKLAPYAGTVHASIRSFDAAGEHEGYDLRACVEAIRKVGFEHTLAIEYIGPGDPVEPIRKAREILQAAIDEE